MKLNPNIASIVIITFIIAGGAYWYFATQTGTDAPLTADTSVNPAQSRFQSLITQLPKEFDTSLFSNPNFLALVDLTIPIKDEPTGRSDPFAPISAAPNK